MLNSKNEAELSESSADEDSLADRNQQTKPLLAEVVEDIDCFAFEASNPSGTPSNGNGVSKLVSGISLC